MKKDISERLLERVVAGEERAWRDFVEKYFGFILSLARRYCRGDEDLAEELCVFALENLHRSGTDGVTFARLRHFLASRERFGGRSRFTTWLALVVRNLFRDWFRARIGRLRKTPDQTPQNELLCRWPTAFSSTRVGLDEERLEDTSARSRPDLMLEMKGDMCSALRLGQFVKKAVALLPELTRQVLLLHVVRGLGGEDIRRIMGFSERQRVYDEIARAKRLLRRKIAAGGFSREEVSAALENLAQVFSDGLLSDLDSDSVVKGQKPC